MTSITIIGEELAKKDEEFIFIGPQNDCKNCKLKNICFNLKQYHRYKITNVRDKRHSCTVHKGDAIVVEVEEQPIETAIDKKYTKGSAITLDKKECDEPLCPYYDLCTNKAIQPGKKYIIENILETIPCEKDKSLQRVILTEKK
ncbi:MAG: UPF0179 family protein [Candidatus Thermoplasmatota archaeon]|nr:UPF0179 family protein [Candidatus Thermoplasmatota archaeon]MBS3801156.1 UPF0179 family protein [Candidatus Thermoplasmatota archaeon]